MQNGGNDAGGQDKKGVKVFYDTFSDHVFHCNILAGLLKDFCLGACGCPALPGNIYRGSVFVSMSHCPLLRGDLRVRGIFRIEKNGVQSSKN